MIRDEVKQLVALGSLPDEQSAEVAALERHEHALARIARPVRLEEAQSFSNALGRMIASDWRGLCSTLSRQLERFRSRRSPMPTPTNGTGGSGTARTDAGGRETSREGRRHPYDVSSPTMWMLPTSLYRYELDWIGSDVHGRIGFFSTAGFGPVHERVAAWTEENVSELAARIHAMPIITGARFHPRAPHKGAEWLVAAERGFFAFDWDAYAKAYALLAIPVEPLHVAHILDPVVRTLLSSVTLEIDFAASTTIATGLDER